MNRQKKTLPKCDMASSQNEELVAQLHHAQKVALDDTANALESIILQQKLTIAVHAPYESNIMDAKKDVIDAMVNLAVASSGDDLEEVRAILSDYGLEDMI
jgi:hypothetical protein